MPRLHLLCALAAIALPACGKGEQGSPTTVASATPAAASSAAHAKPSAAPSPPPAPTAAPAAGCGYDGTYEAVGYACKGEKRQPFPSFLRWTFGMRGADATFTEAFTSPMPSLPGCTNKQAFSAACGGTPTLLTLTGAGPGACDPPNCLKANRKDKDAYTCGKTRTTPLLWNVVEHTATTLVLTSVEPFKLTTCTSMHKSNPLTVWWQKK